MLVIRRPRALVPARRAGARRARRDGPARRQAALALPQAYAPRPTIPRRGSRSAGRGKFSAGAAADAPAFAAAAAAPASDVLGVVVFLYRRRRAWLGSGRIGVGNYFTLDLTNG